MHQVLAGYLEPSRGPTDVAAPRSDARHPVAPAGPIPPGARPIPTSSEANKKSNAAIPVAREAVFTFGIGGLQHTLGEGEVAIAERQAYSTKRSSGASGRAPSYVRVRSIESANARLALPENRRDAGTPPDPTDFEFYVDGVVNNTDGADENREFRDNPLANVVVQGPVRYAHNGPIAMRDVVYVGLFEEAAVDPGGAPVGGGKVVLQFKQFSSRDLSHRRGDRPPLDTLRLLWRVGSVIDSKQSPGFLTVLVGVERVCGITERDIARLKDEEMPASHKDKNPGAEDEPHRYTYRDDGLYEVDGVLQRWTFRKFAGGENVSEPIRAKSLEAVLSELHIR